MVKDIIGNVVSAIMIVVMLFVTPMYYVGIIQWARDESQALAWTRAVVDEIIDSKELVDSTLEEYNIKMASLSTYYNTTITRQKKITNPAYDGDGTYTSYVTVDDNRHYDQGDLVIIHVKQIGAPLYQAIARVLLGAQMPSDEFTIPGRVR